MGSSSDPALVLVATPIGNLGDLAPRAVEALTAAHTIACEDTRRTRQLLSHAGVKAPRLLVVNDHNEASQAGTVIALLDGGRRVAVVTDAGMPTISDPGERLVARVAEAGHRIEVVPGPSAAVAALAVSGLPTGRFCFEGFLPRKRSARDERLEALRTERRTAVLYEAPHRVRQTVAELSEALGPARRLTISRELTKLHEETWRGTLGAAAEHLAAIEPRGEYVIVIDGAPPPPGASAGDIAEALRRDLERGATRRDAVLAVAADLGVPRRRVYEVATGLP